MGIILTVAIGFVIGLVARLFMSGYRQTPGCDLSTKIGILGAVTANFLGLMLGWFAPGQGAGILGAAIGAVVALAGWNHAQKRA